MRDVAVALEAVLVLDSRLDEVGLLASTSDRTTRWVWTRSAWCSPRPHGWRPGTPRARAPKMPHHGCGKRSPSTVVEPVSMVSTPDDLAAAQQRLARFLRPMHGQ